jgi:hypothetical protein
MLSFAEDHDHVIILMSCKPGRLHSLFVHAGYQPLRIGCLLVDRRGREQAPGSSAWPLPFTTTILKSHLGKYPTQYPIQGLIYQALYFMMKLSQI